MNCPKCSANKSKVIDSRSFGNGTRRTRKCAMCHKRFATFELPMNAPELLEKAGLLKRRTEAARKYLGAANDIIIGVEDLFGLPHVDDSCENCAWSEQEGVDLYCANANSKKVTSIVSPDDCCERWETNIL